MTQKYSLSYDIIFVSLVAALSGFLFGYHTGIISGALLFITEQFNLTTLEQGLIVSIILIGGVAGALCGGLLTDFLGRKRTLFLTVILFLVGTFCLYDAQTYGLLMIGRFIAGLAIGIGSVTAPLYIAEISPSRNRGALVSLNQLMITIGILVSFWVSYMYAGSADWRDMFTIGFIPAILQFVGLFFIPESPAWLISQRRTAAAEKSLHRLEMDTSQAHFVDEEKKVDHPTSKSFRALLDPGVRLAFFVGIGLSVFQQVTGINTVIYYAPHIFQLAGFASAESAILATTWVGILNVLMTIVALWLVDKAGRRVLLLISLGGMTLSLALLGTAFLAFSSEEGLLAIVCLMVYIASFAIGLGIVPWLIISEIYPLGIRGRAMGVAVFANWGANYIVSLTFLPLIQFLGIGSTYWVFTLMCVLAFWFAMKKVPETKDKTFDEIQRFWQK
jgi:MFS transporter, SP family, galactose:H+ symporter